MRVVRLLRSELRRVWAALGPCESVLVVAAAALLGLLTADVLAGGLATYVDEQIADALGATPDVGDASGRSVSSLGELGLSGATLAIVVLVTVQATFRLWPIVLTIGNVGGGLLLVLGGHGSDDELLRQIQQRPEPAIRAGGDDRRSRELRTYGIGAQIIADLGVRRMRVMSAPWKLSGLAGFGLEVVEYVNPLEHRGGASRPVR